MCLSGAAKCWFLTQPEETKNNLDRLADQFKTDYLRNNKWLNSTRLGIRKLLSSESAEKYIADMSELALLVGIKEEELSKALIRGLPPKLRWYVVCFNPTSLSETIQKNCWKRQLCPSQKKKMKSVLVLLCYVLEWKKELVAWKI